MALAKTSGARIAGICCCVPSVRFDNLRDCKDFPKEDVLKITSLAGVSARRLAGDYLCSSDLCSAAAARVMGTLEWEPNSIDAIIMVTQTPDYFLPSTACVVHQRLGLSDNCAALDVGLGCSGYPYGMWLSSMMLQCGGARRVLLLHGETPTRFTDSADRSVSLLFGDAGSATALEALSSAVPSVWHYALHTDGSAAHAMMIEAGAFRDRFARDRKKHCVRMDGAAVFNFTIKRVPTLIEETLDASGVARDEIDYFIFHQSNQYIIKHICSKCRIPLEKVPMILTEYGNTGGVSVPLTMTAGSFQRPGDRALKLLLLGYGVGLSWGSALVELDKDAVLETIELSSQLHATA
jgi:3-oxoacyl-[acyl-carrier-protein] synthase-3